MSELPRVLHQIWLGPRPRPERLLESVRRMHSHWRYQLWTEDNLPPLRNQDAFDRSPTWHQKSDILRYELLWRYGGVYVDADSLALKPLDPLLAGVEMFAGYERDGSPLVANGVIGCAPRHPDVDRLVREIDIDRPGEAWEIVGPAYFTQMIERHRMAVTIHPASFFYPVHHTERLRLHLGFTATAPSSRHSFLVQYWGTTTNLYEPWLRRMARWLRYEIDRRRAENKG